MRFRFLQLSDLHFGAPMNRSKLGLSAEKLAMRQAEFEALVRGLPAVVEAHRVDAVLLPGDLWDHEALDRASLEQFRILYQAICDMPVPVVITPGNHDFYSPSSFYHPDQLAALNLPPWPPTVLLFTDSRFQSLPLSGWEETVRVTGRAFHDNIQWDPDPARRQHRVLSGLTPRVPSEKIELLQFHGSRDDANRFEEKLSAPFSRDEVLALGFDYTAVGHYHRHDVFLTDAGAVKGAYSGSPFARGLDEKGPRVVLIGDIVKTGDAPATVTLETLPLDNRQIRPCTLTLLGQDTAEAVAEQIIHDLDRLATPGDMILCELVGQVPAGIDLLWDALEARLNERFFHVSLDPKGLSPAYEVSHFNADPRSLEARFIAAMESRRQDLPETDRAFWNQALYLGLDALILEMVRKP